MTLVELLMFMAVLFAGGIIGAAVAWAVGSLLGSLTSNFVAAGVFIGAGVGFVSVFVYGWWFGKMDKIHPPCRCGRSNWDDFSSTGVEGFTNVTQCRCGRQYVYSKWHLWYELTDGRTAMLFMKRNLLGRWTKPTEKDIANRVPVTD